MLGYANKCEAMACFDYVFSLFAAPLDAGTDVVRQLDPVVVKEAWSAEEDQLLIDVASAIEVLRPWAAQWPSCDLLA